MTFLNYKTEGQGPPLLLLHGFPETLDCWDDVSQILRAKFTVIRVDLPGYGNSPQLEDSSKRSMAKEVYEMMSDLGYCQFSVAGHDRGGLVGARLALDYPDAVLSLVVLDVIPALDFWALMDSSTAIGSYHMAFLALDNGVPQAMLSENSEVFVDSFLDGWCANGKQLDERRKRLYKCAFNPAGVCADYRAGATTDVEHDMRDRKCGKRIAAPLCVLWQEPEGISPPFDPIEVWSRWAEEPRGYGLDCGHFLPEETPEEVAASIAEHAAVSLMRIE